MEGYSASLGGAHSSGIYSRINYEENSLLNRTPTRKGLGCLQKCVSTGVRAADKGPGKC